MSEEVSYDTRDELDKQLTALDEALKSVVHHPTCTTPRHCPQRCACRKSTAIKRLNNYTAICWTMAGRSSSTASLLTEDKVYMKSAMQALHQTFEDLYNAFGYHDDKNATLVRHIMSRCHSITSILYQKLCSGPHYYDNKVDVERRLKEIKTFNLRERI